MGTYGLAGTGIACPKSWRDVSQTWTSSISGLQLGFWRKKSDPRRMGSIETERWQTKRGETE